MRIYSKNHAHGNAANETATRQTDETSVERKGLSLAFEVSVGAISVCNREHLISCLSIILQHSLRAQGGATFGCDHIASEMRGDSLSNQLKATSEILRIHQTNIGIQYRSNGHTHGTSERHGTIGGARMHIFGSCTCVDMLSCAERTRERS